ncbi:MAG: transglutaminase domain-containing protein [Deltaproteobacteria bacterium]|nr:transglutaminase domain-containing protein [Deltaproteobacteria bacterium]
MSATGRLARIAEVIPFALAAAAYGLVSPTGGVIAGVALFVALTVGARLTIDLFAQIALALSGVVAGVLSVAFLLPRPPGPQGWSALALGLFLAGALRFVVVGAAGGPKVTQSFALASFAATGGFRTPEFRGVLVFFVVAEAFALWMLESGRPSFRELRWKEWAGAIVGAVIATVVAVFGAIVLPRAHDRVVEAVERYLSIQQGGFDSRITLGQMRGMMTSKRKVLRVLGENPVHLRGIVYGKYKEGRWSAVQEGMTPILIPGERESSTTEVENLVRHSQLFVPLGASALGGPNEKARANGMGVVYTADPRDDRIWFRVEKAPGPGRPPVAPPSAQDLEVPEAIRGELVEVAGRFAKTASGAVELTRELERGLSDGFRYSLEYERTEGVDPVIDFLNTHREGHCEYFASAMTLLLRVSGVPARVIGGFLVTEESPIGGYFVVREGNAHAWVEAFVDGRWRTFDPTPAAWLNEQMPDQMDWATALVDGLGVATAGLARWLNSLTVGQLSLAAGGLLGLWGLYRWLFRRRPRVVGTVLELDPPLECFEKLSQRLEREGLVRGRWESLESFAARVEEEEGLGPAPSELLRKYAAWRYGRVGELREIERGIDELCATPERRAR